MVPLLPVSQYSCNIYVPYITKIKDLKSNASLMVLETNEDIIPISQVCLKGE